MFSDFWFRLRALIFSRRAEAELADEIQFHLESERAKLAARGLGEHEARRRSMVAFGGVSRTSEDCRDARGVRPLADLSKDIRHGWRSLRHNPLFAVAVVGSLALGIGANVTVFTLMRAALWRPMPVAHAEQIFHVRRSDPASTDGRDRSLSYVLFRQLRDSAGSMAQVVAKGSPGRRKFGLDPDSRERVTGEAVTEDFFDVLGVAPAHGRLFIVGDDGASGGRRVAVLSHRFWTTRFNADRGVLGRTVYIDEIPFDVVGVAARGFDGVDAEQRVQLWMPVTADVRITPNWLRSASYYWLTLLARVRSETDVPALQGALDSRFRAHLDRDLLPGMPPRVQAMLRSDRIQLRPAVAGLATTGRRYESQLWVLAGIASCIFVICCANVANLVRARNARRRDEFVLRRALGASGHRLFRQLCVEGVMLGALGVAGSLLAAPWVAHGILALLPAAETLTFDVSPDRAIVAVATLLGIASALIAVTVPAWRPAMPAATVGSPTRMTRRLVVSRATVATQLAIVLVLVVVSGLCLSVLQRLRAVDLGFDADSVTTAELSFPKSVTTAQASEVFENVRQRLRQSGASESSSYAFPSVYDIGGSSMGIVPAGYSPAPGEDTSAGTIAVGPEFFTTLRIALRNGRMLTPIDMRASVVVVNETFARRYFAGRGAVGQAIRIPAQPEPRIATIVGVVADVRHYGVRSKPWPMVYQPGASAGSQLLVRGDPPTAVQAAIQEAVRSVGAPAQIESARPLADAVAAMVSRERLLAVLSSSVALVAIPLAALGLYGVVAYGATSRRAEFGIRLALGARRADVQRLVVSETFAVVAIGVAAGIGAAFAASRVLGRLLPDSPPLQWPLVSGAALILIVVTLVASWIPAWRASLIDPAETLRSE